MTVLDLNQATNNPLLGPNVPLSLLSTLIELRESGGIERIPGFLDPGCTELGCKPSFWGSPSPSWYGSPAGDTLPVDVSWFPGEGDPKRSRMLPELLPLP